MTLEDLKNRCNTQGIKYSYGLFREAQEPPHLIAMTSSTDNFMADNIVYKKKLPINMYYTYIYKDINEQNIIENNILQGIGWNKSEENYLSDENIWQVIYYFELDNKNETQSV